MKNAIDKNCEEVEQALRIASTGEADIAFLQHYMGTAIPMIGGLAVPVQRAIFKNGYRFSSLPLNEQMEAWDEIWNSTGVFEVMSQCLMFVQKNIAKLDRKKLWNTTRKWVKKIDNWGHSDMLSGIYSWLMEQDEDLVYPQLVKWNTSKNAWERRQSLVSIFEYSSKRKKVLPVNKVLPLVQNLLSDKDKFVQKGVGWCLRECGNVYPKETGKFLLDHYSELSSIAFAAATEKIKASEKEKLKALRKGRRRVM